MNDVTLTATELELDSVAFRLRYAGEQSPELTSIEFRILALFQLMGYAPLSKEVIQKRVWGRDQSRDKTLNVHFTYLRKKLAPVGLTVTYLKPGNFVISTQAPALDTIEG